jgi:hypothetical protein
MPRKSSDTRARADLLRQMAAINLEIVETRRRLPEGQANAELGRLTRLLKKLEAKFLK